MKPSEVVAALAQAMLETVCEAGEQGAPAGVLYAACQTYGVPLEAFNKIMAALVDCGMITKHGNVYRDARLVH